jgi:HK97 family phage major capsid protein
VNESTPTTEPVVVPEITEEPATYATREDFDRLERLIAAATIPANDRPPERPGNFRSLHEYVMTQHRAREGHPAAVQRIATYHQAAAEQLAGLEQYALADDTTTTATGLVPDYLSSEIIGLIDNFRPFVDSIPSDPVGPYGMSVVYPNVTTKPDVGVQAVEKTQVTSQAMVVGTKVVDLVTFAGASDVSLQLVERSQPSFLDRLFAELAGVYAQRTDAASIAAAKAAAVAAGNVGVVANLGTSAAATWAAVAAGVAGIIADTKRAPTHMWISADRFGQLITLVDSSGRPLLTPVMGGTPGQGTADFTTFEFQYGGLRVIVDPHAAAGTALLGWNGAAATLELRPQQLRALQVDLLGLNVGVWGLFSTVIKYGGGFWTINAA